MTKKYYAFCKILDYGVIICWRLNPDLRLENYRSYIEDIWWFKGLKSSEVLNIIIDEIESDNKNLYILNFSGLAVVNTMNILLCWIYDTSSS